MGLYLLGGLLAPVGGANTLRVTAHYHAMLVGGVTTAFMGVAYRILEKSGLPVGKQTGRLQVRLFGLGVLRRWPPCWWRPPTGCPVRPT